jgi:hypothetical protein
MLVFLGLATSAIAADFAYQADADVDNNGLAGHWHTVSDGVRTKILWTWDDGKTGGSYIDHSRGLGWGWSSLGTGCIQYALPPKGAAPAHPHLDEKEVGSETINGHPTRKFTYRIEYTLAGKTTVDAITEWRATDLHDLVVRTETANHHTMRMHDIVLRAPAAADIALASTPCKYDPVKDDGGYAAQAPGGFRQVRFFDLGCKKIVPLGIVATLPSDYEIRASARFGCFAGTHDDLDRLLAKPDQVDFEAIRHGVIWTRISMETEYRAPHFYSAGGSDEDWDKAMAANGVRGLRIERGDLAGRPSVRVSAQMEGRPVRMCYLGVDDSPAILISYQAPPQVTPVDDAQWARFLGALKKDAIEMSGAEAEK